MFSDLVTREKPVKLEPSPGGKSGALLATYENGVKAIVKVQKEKLPSGYRRQRGIPVVAHPTREVTFRRAAELLGCADLVPETVMTTKAVPDHVASAQLFVPAHHLSKLQPGLVDMDDPRWSTILMEACIVVPKKFWRSLLALDILGGSRDRHANNVGVLIRSEDDRPVYRIAAWDNAVSFGETFDRYHNVFHKFLFRRSVDMRDAWEMLDGVTLPELRDAVGEYLTPREVEHAYLRARFFVDFPYRLPWKVCSAGSDDPSEFPSYGEYFDPPRQRPLHLLRVPA